MKKPTLIWLILMLVVAAPTAQVEECSWSNPVCFGVDWSTATSADVVGIDVNARTDKGLTPLHAAAGDNENPAVIEALLAAGAKVNARTDRGDTPLHAAVGDNENPVVIEALVAAGADVNARTDRGDTPLHAAAGDNENPVVIEALLAAGAKVNARTDRGDTPFDYIKDKPKTKLYWMLHDAQYD